MREIIYYEELQELKPYAVELPEVTGPLPNTDESYSFNAARRQNCPVDLEKYGYVEEEFIISGYANVYEYHDVGLYPKIRDGVPAPKSAYLEMQGEYPDADFVLDEHGNPKGGVRSPYVDVPTKTYTWIDDFNPFNVKTPFSDEKLKRLYPSREDYLKKVIFSTMKMISDGYLLPEDAPAIIFDRMKERIPE